MYIKGKGASPNSVPNPQSKFLSLVGEMWKLHKVISSSMNHTLIELKVNAITLGTDGHCVGLTKMPRVGHKVVSVIFLPEMKGIGELQIE